MKKYIVISAMLGMLISPLIAEETKPMASQAQTKTETGTMTTKSEKSDAQKAAPTKTTSTKPVIKKSKKKMQKAQ